MTREEDLAIAYANLGPGSGPKDYIATAKALKRLKAYPEYRSNERLASDLPVTGEMIRQFLTILKLPEEVQQLFGPDGLKLEHGRRLWQLTRRHPELQRDVANAILGLNAMEARDLVKHVLDNPHQSIAESLRAVLDSQSVVTREYHVIALLSESEFTSLKKEARSLGVPADAVVTSIVRDWLAARADD